VPESADPPRRRPRWPLGLGAAGVALAAAAMAFGPSGGAPPLTVTVDRPAPAFELPNLRPGQAPVSLASAGGRPAVLNFWASWCEPCLNELPAFQAASVRLAGRVAFLGINHRDGRNPALDLLAETGVTYPSGHDPEGEVAVAFGAQGMPTTVFVAADGRVLERRTGELSAGQLTAILDRLFPPAT
jgi:cytochrome c biogenesis protein CcmG, thiol:disulfide interchange protein DsbE